MPLCNILGPFLFGFWVGVVLFFSQIFLFTAYIFSIFLKYTKPMYFILEFINSNIILLSTISASSYSWFFGVCVGVCVRVCVFPVS